MSKTAFKAGHLFCGLSIFLFAFPLLAGSAKQVPILDLDPSSVTVSVEQRIQTIGRARVYVQIKSDKSLVYEQDMGPFNEVPEATRSSYKIYFENICRVAKERNGRLILDPNLKFSDQNVMTIADKQLVVRDVISRIEELEAEVARLRAALKN